MTIKIVVEVYGPDIGTGILRSMAKPEFVEIGEEELREIAMQMSAIPREKISEVRLQRLDLSIE